MSNALPGTFAPGADFDAPLEMLSACHTRIEWQCATLRRLVPHLAAHGGDADARAAADAVMRCFDTSAAHHHADEEADLFPALLEAMPGSDPVCLRELVEALCAEHRRADPEIGGFDLAAIVGGPALCLLGNAMSGRASSLRLPPSHVVGVALLGVVAIVLRSAPALLLLLATMVVLARVAAGDWLSLARLRLEAQGGALREGQANLRPPRGGSQ